MTDSTLFPDMPPLPPPPGPMTRERLDSVLRAAAVYHADEGTSGWLLSEDQFAAILAAADEYRSHALGELAAEFDELGGGRSA